MTDRAGLPAPEDKAGSVRRMFDAIAPRYDLVNRVMTFGLDVRWRKRAIETLELHPGAVVADVACGTGDFCREAAAVGAKPIGFDVSLGMLRAARTTAPLVQADGLALPLRDDSVDAITCGFALRNVVDIDLLFAEFARVSKPGARFALLEVAQPSFAPVRFGHHLYFNRVVPVIGGLLSDRDAYRYLPRSTVYLPPTDRLLDMLVAAGFTDVAAEPLGMGAAQLLT
ncbi:MAG TPA: ubiquinone/menaquinone biosynthesis methyltransferase, partial [Actinomycetota bacterium]|nr:ubiquinone/menaquinone biosynthesis methyltransferase [Actinomycetota bacterium]